LKPFFYQIPEAHTLNLLAQALSKIIMLSLVTGMAFDGLYGDDDAE